LLLLCIHFIGLLSCSLMILFLVLLPSLSQIYALSLHDALPISRPIPRAGRRPDGRRGGRDAQQLDWRGRDARSSAPPRGGGAERSEEHTSELQSLRHLVCRLLLEKKKHSFIAGFMAEASNELLE